MHRLTRHLALRVVALPVAIACAFILAEPAVGAPTPGTRLWATHDTVSFENSTGIVASPDGSKVFVTGNKGPRAYNASTGAKIWSTLRGFNNYSYIAASPDGSTVFVTGEEYDGDPGGYNFATFAYSASTGTKRWRSDFTSRGVVGDLPTAIVVSPDGSTVFVTGATFDEGFGKDYNTVAYNATTGAELWSRRYDAEPNSEGAAGIATNPDGTEVFVTGSTATVAYDAATGRLLWVKDVRPSGFWWTVASGGTGADVFVAGSSGGGNGNLTVVAYDARTGAKRWVQRFQSGQGASDGESLVVSPDGSVVYVGGWNQDSDLYFDYETIAFGTSSGKPLWARRFDTNAHDPYPHPLGVTPDGSEVFISGIATGRGRGATVAYDGDTGSRLWVARGAGGSGLAVGSGGPKIFESETDSSYHYLTVAYAA